MTTSVTRLKALSRHRMLLALPAAAFGVTLAACGGGSAAHPAAPKPAGVVHSHAHSAPPHAVPPGAGHRPCPYRQSDPAGQRRRP
jgi:hypothetical protein